MNVRRELKPARRRVSELPWRVAALGLALAGAVQSGIARENPRPQTPREWYNAGTEQLREGNLEAARDSLRAAVGSNHDQVMPAALYNLGHVRYEIGERELQKILRDPSSVERPRNAAVAAQVALQNARQALNDGDIDGLVRAYRRGAGARRELRAATEAVREALKQFGFVLNTWERASADFRGTHELQPADTRASSNASIVDRRIAALVDMMARQQQAMMQCDQAGDQLKDAMREIKKGLPKDKADELGPGDEDDEDEEGPGDKEKRELPGRGKEKGISQEQAAQLLQSIQLDSQRTLPVSNRSAKPERRDGGDW